MLANTFSSIVNMPLTVLVTVVTFLVLMFFAWRTSKGLMISLIVGIIISGAISQIILNTTFYNELISRQTRILAINIGLYSFMILCSTLILRNFIHKNFSSLFRLKILQMAMSAVVAEGLFFVYLFKVFSIENYYSFSPYFVILFGGEYSALGWFITMLFVFVILRNNKKL